jgi:hypothetical protein
MKPSHTITLACWLTMALVAPACSQRTRGRARWAACERALAVDPVHAQAHAHVRAVADGYDLSCGHQPHRHCSPNALPLEAVLDVQHQQRLSAARAALAAIDPPEGCRELPD